MLPWGYWRICPTALKFTFIRNTTDGGSGRRHLTAGETSAISHYDADEVSTTGPACCRCLRLALQLRRSSGAGPLCWHGWGQGGRWAARPRRRRWNEDRGSRRNQSVADLSLHFGAKGWMNQRTKTGRGRRERTKTERDQGLDEQRKRVAKGILRIF